MTTEQYDYKVERIVKYGDGDSFWAVVSKDIGFFVSAQALIHVRVTHVDTPERKQVNYIEASAFTRAWIESRTVRVRSVERDEFGRWLCDVYDEDTGLLLSDALKQAGLAKPDSRWNA